MLLSSIGASDLLMIAITIMFGMLTIIVTVIGFMIRGYMVAQKKHRDKADDRQSEVEKTIAVIENVVETLSETVKTVVESLKDINSNQTHLTKIVRDHEKEIENLKGVSNE